MIYSKEEIYFLVGILLGLYSVLAYLFLFTDTGSKDK